MNAADLSSKIRDLVKKHGNINVLVYDKKSETEYEIIDVKATETDINIIIDTSTETEKRIYGFYGKENVKEINYYDDFAAVQMKDGSTKTFMYEIRSRR